MLNDLGTRRRRLDAPLLAGAEPSALGGRVRKVEAAVHDQELPLVREPAEEPRIPVDAEVLHNALARLLREEHAIATRLEEAVPAQEDEKPAGRVLHQELERLPDVGFVATEHLESDGVDLRRR